jgi:uncharacterized protein (TIGR03435 family)
MNAYDMRSYQVFGPDTIDSVRFDFQVVVPEGATKEQVRLMWRNLLETRFGMKSHLEQREFQVDDLVVGPRGHKLVENNQTAAPPPDAATPPPPPGPPPVDKDGRLTMDRPGLLMMISSGPNGITAKATGKAQPISELVTMLSNQIGHPIVDKTGLTAKYDFYVEYFPTNLPGPLGAARVAEGPRPQQNGAAPAAPDLGLDLGSAIQQQLGLRLVSSKGKLDVVVVDKVNSTPTDN